MASVCFHHLSPHTYFLLLLQNQNQLYCRRFTCRTQLFQYRFSSTHFSSAFSPPHHVCRSNTHTFNDTEEDEGEGDDNDDFDIGMEVLEEYIDSIWIFKVFGTYGWMSPVILLSWLLATGPKAFLIALALAILQSTFMFAFQKMQQGKGGKTRPELNNTKKKTFKKTRKRTSSSASYRSRNVKRTKEEANEIGSSWVSETDYSVYTSDGSRADFGGWDELDDAGGPSRRRARKSTGFRGSSSGKKSKLRSRWGGASDTTTPLLLRLLISIFPFLDFLE